MAEGLISEYIDRKGIEEDTGYFLESLNKILVKLKAITSYQGEIAMSKTFGQATSAAAKLRKEVDETEKLQKEIDSHRAKRLALDNQHNKILVEEKELLRQRNQEVKNSIREQNAAAGSIEQLRASLIRLNKEYDNLSAADRNSDVGNNLKTQIKGVSDELKVLEGETGRFQRNVGNYQGSAKIIVDALERVKVKVADTEKQFGRMSPEAAAARNELDGLQRVTSNPQFLNIAGKVGDSNAELRQFTRTLIELERAGLGSTDFANELRKNLAQLKDDIQDTREEIKAMSSDSRAFDQLSSSVNFLAGTYQTFIGIQALSGEQSEETQETIKRLVAVQSVANGLQEISQQLTQRGTLINKAYTFVQTQYTIATNASAVATTRLAAATKLLGFGLAIGAIVGLVYLMQKLSTATSEAAQKRKVLNEISNKAAESYGAERAQLDILVASIKKEGATRSEKLQSLKQLQESFPGYFDNLKTEADLNNKLEGAYKKAAEGILLKARAQAAGDLLAQTSAKRLTSEVELAETIAFLNTREAEEVKLALERNGPKAVESVRRTFDQSRKAAAQEFLKEVEDLDNKSKIILDQIISSNDQIKKLGGKTTDTKTTGTAKDKKEDDTLQKQLQAEFEAIKLQKERRIALNREIAEAEDGTFQERTTALGQYVKEQIKLVELEAEFEKTTKKLTNAEIEVLEQQKQNKILAIVQEGSKKLQDIQEDFKKDLGDNKEIELRYSSTYKAVNDIVQKSLAKQKKDQEKALEDEKELLQKRKEAYKELSEELTETAFAFLTAGIEREKNEIQDSIDALEQKKQKEIEVANQTITNAAQRADAIAVIEARANAQREALERRKRQLDQERARYERVKNIADIIQSTAIAVVQALGSKPWGPQNIALAAIVGAIGAAQIARVIATPIPRFFRGKKATDSYEGHGVVGDGGKREAIIRKTGEVEITPNTPTLTYVYRGDVIEPDADALLRIAKKSTDRTMSKAANIFHVQPDTSTAKAIDRMGARVENAIKRMPQTNVQVTSIMKKWIRSNNSIDHYL